MPDFRCHCDPDAIADTLIHLSKEESNHLVGANRARKGDPVSVFDGKGNEWETVLLDPQRNRAILEIERHRNVPRPPYSIALAQALPKGKLLDSIIRKATEIGAETLYPITTQHTESKIAQAREKDKRAKWQAAAIEAAKQSGNPYPLDVKPIASFEDFLAESSNYRLKLIASLTDKARPLREHLNKQPGSEIDSAIWLVGPEGDFTEQETEQAFCAGFLPTCLGPHVMRCETAATYALSVISYELDPTRSGR